MSVNNSGMEAKYSDPLPCRTCKYVLPDVGGYSRAESLFCEEHPDISNKKPSGVLFGGKPCKNYKRKM